MKTAIILAAGLGRRLRPLTIVKNKCLLDINGKPILLRMIDSLLSHGVEKIVAVTGHKSEQLREYVCKARFACDIRFIHNRWFKTTNNIYSFWLARDELENGFILLDSDLIFDEEILTLIDRTDYSSCLCIDREAELTDEAMKVRISSKNEITEIGKDIDVEHSNGEFIGIAKFSADDISQLMASLTCEIQENRNHNGYYEAVFGQFIKRGNALYSLDISHLDWAEIDTLRDLEKAKLTWRNRGSMVRAVRTQ